jgi:hypothetical protein
MDNPVTNHAIKLYTEFGQKIAECKHNSRLLNYHFTLFLEDITVNDPILKSMTHHEKITVVGCLLLFNAHANHINTTDAEDGFHLISVLMTQFASRKAPSGDYQDLIKAYVATKYVWDGTGLYQWNGTVWIRCSQYDLSVFKPMNLFVHAYGLDHAVVQEACAAMRDHLGALNLTVAKWNDTPQSLIDLVRSNPCSMNQKYHKVTVFDGALNLDDSTLEKADPYDYSTLAVPYAPVQAAPDGDVEKVFGVFKCEVSQIQLALQSCLRGDNQIIFISGPAGSGCTALWTILKNVCGPYADPEVEGHRAIFLGEDDLDVLNTLNVSERHRTMVFDCTAPSHLKDTYHGRPVMRLTLEDIISVDECVVDVEVFYSTRLRLSYVLGYLLLPEMANDNPMAGLENFLGPDIINAIDDDVDNIDFTSLGMDFLSRAFSMMGGAKMPQPEPVD